MSKKNDQSFSDFSNDPEKDRNLPICYLKPGERLREGMICPRCKNGKMMYNGMLKLVCPYCGLTEAGACT